MPTETTILLAVVGMIGLFATATVFQRANRITSRYYSKKMSLTEGEVGDSMEVYFDEED